MKKKKLIKTKPPVVVVLGHVDHGKTSLLDTIRGTSVQKGEAGGITQNFRAHTVNYHTKDDKDVKITFLDTPGHEAFFKMRQRGAVVADLAVLVVALDDGVQPQTKEAAEFALEAKIPVVVALNKCDIKGTDKAKVKRDLSNIGIQLEELGGDVLSVETSAKEKKGLDELLETIVLVNEMHPKEDDTAETNGVEAVILESTIDKSLGSINLCLIKSGILKNGFYFSEDGKISKIRAMKDDSFNDTNEAGPSSAVWILGSRGQLQVGQKITFFENETDIKTEIKKTEAQEEEKKEFDSSALFELISSQKEKDAETKTLNIILKSENQGTLEVAEEEIAKLGDEEVTVKIISTGTGDISEEDIIKAKDYNGVVIGFKSNISKRAENFALTEKVLVRNYEIIYSLLDEINEVVESFKSPVEIEVEIARATIKKVFILTNGKKIAGCEVKKGIILKGYTCFVEDPKTKKRLGNAKITSLKHGKDEVREAQKGAECGIQLEPEVELEKGYEIVCFKIETTLAK